MSNAVKIIRALAYANGKEPLIWNDKLKNGKRSVKVWGWTKTEYQWAKDVLHAAKMTAKIVKRPQPYTGYRLWVD